MSVPLPSDAEVRLRALPKAEVHLHPEGCFEAALIEASFAIGDVKAGLLEKLKRW